MLKTVIGISIEKIQQVIYDSIRSEIQESQNNDNTLKRVVVTSKQISEGFYHSMKEFIDEILLQSSGCIIFTSSSDDEAIKRQLKKMYKQYYETTKGAMELRYYISKMKIDDNADKLKAIQTMKRSLKEHEALSFVIEENQDWLFSLQKVKNNSHLQDKSIPDYGAFVENINQLYHESENEKYFRIAVIKADFDGLGKLFSAIEDYETYKKISEVLSQFICLDNLDKGAKKIMDKSEELKKWIFPFYAAGDDLFFAVEIFNLNRAIELCVEILNKINTKLLPVKQHLNLSVGVEITRNHEPIRYFYGRVEEQLQRAKQAEAKQAIKGIKISIANTTFTCSYNERKKRYEGNWVNFQNDLEKLRNAQAQDIKVRAFLFTLLEKLASFKKRKAQNNQLANIILYHCIPQFINDTNKEKAKAELDMINIVLSQLVDYSKNTGTPKKPQHELQFDNIDNLINYIRILLMFTDERFEKNQKSRIQSNPFQVIKIRGSVFNRTLRYLYNNNLSVPLPQSSGIENFRTFFVHNDVYQVEEKDEKGKVKLRNIDYYQTLPLSNSIFYRMKRDGIDFEKNMEMMDNFVQSSIAIPSKTKQKPQALTFNYNKVIQLKASVEPWWTSDYVDSLYVFYRFKEARIHYCVQFPSPKKGKKKEK